MAGLWQSDSIADWAHALSRYPEALQQKRGEDLVASDRFVMCKKKIRGMDVLRPEGLSGGSGGSHRWMMRAT